MVSGQLTAVQWQHFVVYCRIVKIAKLLVNVANV